MIKLSATSIKDYVVCRSKIRYRWLRLTDLPTGVALIKGGAIHDTIEKYEKSEITAEQIPYTYQELLTTGLSNGNVVFTRWDSTNKLLSSGQKMLENYLNNKLGKIEEVEWSFELDMTTPENIPYQIIGRIDQIVAMGDKKCVVDLKSSRLKPTIYEILGDYQFSMYALAYKLEYGELPHKVYNFHLASGDYVEYPRTGSDIKSLIQKMDEIVVELNSIKEWKDYHKDKGWHCNSCMYRDACYSIDTKSIEF